MNRTSAPGACATSSGAAQGSKTIVFGLLKRDDCVYTEIVPDASRNGIARHTFAFHLKECRFRFNNHQ